MKLCFIFELLFSLLIFVKTEKDISSENLKYRHKSAMQLRAKHTNPKLSISVIYLIFDPVHKTQISFELFVCISKASLCDSHIHSVVDFDIYNKSTRL